MLEFIIGRSGTGKTEYCLQSVAEAIRKAPIGTALLFITPAHLTYKSERKLAGFLRENGNGFMRGQVFSFQRLARQVLLETGGGIYSRLSPMGKRLLLKKISDRQEKNLKFFNRAVKRRGFSEELADSIKEFKGFGISPKYLKEKADLLEEQRLMEKIQDLATLYEDFTEQIAGRYHDAEDSLDALVKHIHESDYLKDSEIWIDGFAYFNPQERNIINELLKTAGTIHVSLLMDPDDDEANESQTGLFHDAWEIHELLKKMAVKEKQAVNYKVLRVAKRFKADGIAAVEKGLFSVLPFVGKASEGVRLVEAANRRRELEAAAADIVRLCRKEGYSWKEIGVLFRNPDDYGTLPEMIFGNYGIPFFCDFKRPGIHHPLAELIRSSFDVLQRWQYEPIFRAVKTGFFPLTREQSDFLENYVLRFGIKDSAWTKNEDWHWVKRYDELENGTEDYDESQLKELETVNMLRQRVTVPLLSFSNRIKQAGNVKEMTEAVYLYLEQLQVPQQLESLAEEAERAGRLADAAVHQQIWNDVIDMLEQFVIMCGEEKLSVKEFASVFDDGLDALNIALIPPGHDYVTVSSFDRNSLVGVRALYILGANEGVMPRRCQEKGLLSDAERLYLAEHDIKLAGGSKRESFSEANVLYRGFVTGSEYLWVSYPLADADGKGVKQSMYVNRLRKLFVPELEPVCIGIDETQTALEPSAMIAEKRQALTALSTVLRNYMEKPADMGFWQDVYNYYLESNCFDKLFSIVMKGIINSKDIENLPEKLAEKLYTKNNRLKASISRFESFRKCPFKHFLEHGLKLKERDFYKFKVQEHGTFLHAVMAEFGENLLAEGKKWADVSPDECHVRCTEIVDKLAPRMMGEILYSSEQKNNLRERIQRTAEKSINRLVELDRISKFSPVAFERSFGLEKGDAAPLSINLKNGLLLEVRGKIDRIDQSEDGKYYLIIDYKTGKMEINLTDVFYGVKLQLLTYILLARTIASEGSVPAGVLYCYLKTQKVHSDIPLSDEMLQDEIKKSLRMPGWLLADEAVVKMVDESAKFIRVKIKTNGGFDATCKNSIKSKEEYDVLLKYIEWMLKDTGEKIMAGEINIRPYKGSETACKYCNYQAVCRFDKADDAVRSLKPEKFGSDGEIVNLMEEKTEGMV